MRIILLLAACLVVSGCLKGKSTVAAQATPDPAAKAVIPVSSGVGSDCYTVDLFTRDKVEKPEKDVPEQYRAFLGRWGGGAWNDVWCHDLLVSKVERDGRVEVIDMHAPYEPWNQPASAFLRSGRIDAQGNLRFVHGLETISYRIENGNLIGTRSGLYGNLRVVLKRRDMPPIPTPRPVRMARAATTTISGG